MTLRDLLKKRDKLDNQEVVEPTSEKLPPASEFKFFRTDTHTEEAISPPIYEGDGVEATPEPEPNSPTTPRRGLSRFRRPSHSPNVEGSPNKEHKRLSQRLHIGGGSKSRSPSASSANLPSDLPDISNPYSDHGDQQEKEAQWEQRATILASKIPSIAAVVNKPPVENMSQLSLDAGTGGNQGRPRSVSDAQSDVNIQEAIRLHEDGQLEQATQMFHQLAEQGNVLSQVLYGLSLRHGWGCKPDPERAITYLSAAASNSAAIESEALESGMKKGGAAKGELVLAIFELANCFRYGWGVQIDKIAARQYYETAANLGDTDAMNEAAWCYLEGFGGKKDKFKAAQLLRLAEKNGAKTLGNTWIWKEKYDPK